MESETRFSYLREGGRLQEITCMLQNQCSSPPFQMLSRNWASSIENESLLSRPHGNAGALYKYIVFTAPALFSHL